MLAFVFIWPLSLYVTRGSLLFCPSIQAEKNKAHKKNRGNKTNTLSFSIKTHRQSVPTVIKPTYPTLVWCWHLSSPSFGHSINAAGCNVRLHHYSRCLSHDCVAYIRLLNVLVLLGEEVCAQLSVCIFSLLDNCCIAQAKSDTFYLIFQFLLIFLHHSQDQPGWYLVIPVPHTNTIQVCLIKFEERSVLLIKKNKKNCWLDSMLLVYSRFKKKSYRYVPSGPEFLGVQQNNVGKCGGDRDLCEMCGTLWSIKYDNWDLRLLSQVICQKEWDRIALSRLKSMFSAGSWALSKSLDCSPYCISSPC